MPYLEKADLASHIYTENIDKITRATDSLVERAINAGIGEAKSYCSRYDLNKLFNPDADGYVADENLKMKVLDIVAWQLVKLANPNIDIELFKTMYDDAIKWLVSVQKGQAVPDGWPFPADDADTGYPEGNEVSYTTNTKRNNHY